MDVSTVPNAVAKLADTSLALFGGLRDASCAVVLVLRFVDPSATSPGTSLAFNVVRTDIGPPLNVTVVAAAGYDTTLSLGNLSGSPVLQLIEASTGLAVGPALAVPSACMQAAAAPVFSVAGGTSVVPPGMLKQAAENDTYPCTPCPRLPADTLSVVISSATPGAFLYVSLDGSDPTDAAATTLLWAQVKHQRMACVTDSLPTDTPCRMEWAPLGRP